MFKGKTILITGGTGSLGNALTKKLLDNDVDQIRILSRNEHKQIMMESKFDDDGIRFLIGDIRDQKRLLRAFEDVDIVFHAAALKHVPKVEYNPFEAIKTNVEGSQNVIDACLANGIERAICVGTDKGVSPLNTYGATKLLMEKLFTSAQNYSNPQKDNSKFFAVRYGNVFASSGSVFPKFIDQLKNNKKLTITDLEMSRFSITMDEALDFILKATKFGNGSEIFIPKLKKYTLSQINNIMSKQKNYSGYELTGIRPGEKLHETLINNDEMRYAWEYENLYMILNLSYTIKDFSKNYPGIQKIENMNSYSSDNVDSINNHELEKNIQNL